MIKYILTILLTVCISVLHAQTPSSSDVKFSSIDKSITFGGTLTIPAKKEKVPAIIIVSGTGMQDRDGTMAGHKIFLQLSDYLVSQGYAVLRTDDRGVGSTTGNYDTSTTEDFANDALAAMDFLKRQKGIDPHKIGMLGHSEGGMAISIAASRNKEVAFLISLSGLATDGLEALLQQNHDIVAASQLPDYDKGRANGVNELMFATAYKYADSANMEQKLNSVYDEWKVKDDAYFKTLNVKFDHFRFPVYSYVRSAIGPWYRYFIKYKVQPTLSKIKVPVLAINGDKDLMVSGPSNLSNWKKYISQGGNNRVQTFLIPNLNHLLLPCKTCDSAETPNIKEGISQSVLEIIGKWLRKQV